MDSTCGVVIVDGYNVIHQTPEWKARLASGLAEAREGLLRYCREWLALRKDVMRFHLVFDGDSSVRSERSLGDQRIRIVYSASGETADDRILTLIRDEPDPARVTVISDDGYVRQQARALGAGCLSTADFRGTLAPRKRRAAAQASGGDTDLSAAARKAINDEMKRVWGVEAKP